MVNVVIPMAGLGSRFQKAGYKKPKPFIDVGGIPMIERVIQNLQCQEARYILIARKEHIEKEQLLIKAILQKYNAIFLEIDQITEGSACTILFARKYINNQTPLLIANSDQVIDISVQDFIDDCLNKKVDGSIMTFIDPELNPKWSFAKINEHGFVIEVQEKQPISHNATVGIYFFSKGEDFVNGAIDMIIENKRINNEFYTCPVYNYLISSNKKIIIHDIHYSQMHGLGTPEDLENYLANRNNLNNV